VQRLRDVRSQLLVRNRRIVDRAKALPASSPWWLAQLIGLWVKSRPQPSSRPTLREVLQAGRSVWTSFDGCTPSSGGGTTPDPVGEPAHRWSIYMVLNDIGRPREWLQPANTWPYPNQSGRRATSRSVCQQRKLSSERRNSRLVICTTQRSEMCVTRELDRVSDSAEPRSGLCPYWPDPSSSRLVFLPLPYLYLYLCSGWHSYWPSFRGFDYGIS
jgi:hypothetical protein